MVCLNDNCQVQLLNGNNRGVETLCSEIKRGIVVKSDKTRLLPQFQEEYGSKMLCHCYKNIYRVRWYAVVEFPGNKVFCLRGTAIWAVGLLIGLQHSK